MSQTTPTSAEPKMAKSKLVIRVSTETNQGGRKTMEDFTSVIFDREHDGQAFFGVFDGHGGSDAALYAREHLWPNIKKQKGFYSGETSQVVKAIREGFHQTHMAMWKLQDKWPRTRHGLLSTAGTTAAIAIIRGRKLFVAHVGDSRVVLGRNKVEANKVVASSLTMDHKPESPKERQRIESLGGHVLCSNGVHRVVWRRVHDHEHKGPIRRSTKTDFVPFLAVSRALGDFWSFDYYHKEFVVSPDPDITVHQLRLEKDKFMILASDGVWGVMSPREATQHVDEHVKLLGVEDSDVAHSLIFRTLRKWNERRLRADNTSVIVVFFKKVKNVEYPLTPEPVETDTTSFESLTSLFAPSPEMSTSPDSPQPVIPSPDSSPEILSTKGESTPSTECSGDDRSSQSTPIICTTTPETPKINSTETSDNSQVVIPTLSRKRAFKCVDSAELNNLMNNNGDRVDGGCKVLISGR